jgi:hypothetical protein
MCKTVRCSEGMLWPHREPSTPYPACFRFSTSICCAWPLKQTSRIKIAANESFIINSNFYDTLGSLASSVFLKLDRPKHGDAQNQTSDEGHDGRGLVEKSVYLHGSPPENSTSSHRFGSGLCTYGLVRTVHYCTQPFFFAFVPLRSL